MTEPAPLRDVPTPPIGIYLHAKSFLVAAEALVRDVDEGRVRLRLSSPINHLFSHAIENVLKAYLMTRGFTEKRLRTKPFVHDLDNLYTACLKHRLVLGRTGWADRKRLVELINSHHTTPYTFRYLKVGFARIPSNEAFSALCKVFFDAIYPVVHKYLVSQTDAHRHHPLAPPRN
jgi:hypothetical protein